MSAEEKTSVIKSVEFTDDSYRGVRWYHKLTLENGDKGEIGNCGEARPEWLKEGKSLTYTTKDGKYCKVFMRVDKSQPLQSQQRSSSGFFRETEHQWVTNKKSVIMDSCRNRAKDLWIGKVLKNKKAYEEFALQEYKDILAELGIDKNTVPRELELQIRSCETQDELSMVQKDLTPEDAKNPKVLELLNDQEKVIASKK